MTAALAVSGACLSLAGALTGYGLGACLWVPGILLIVAAYAQHTGPQRAAQRRRAARRGYIA